MVGRRKTKMSTHAMTMNEIRKVGLQALSNALGPVGMVRFLQQFDAGSGDYTQERYSWLKDEDVHSIAEKIKHVHK
jgi:hypothetical protein